MCVWPHGRGLGCVVAPCGPRGATLQYSEDGLRFRRVHAIDPPRAPGPYREDRWQEGSAPGISWGLCQNTASPWPYLQRFDTDLRATAHRADRPAERSRFNGDASGSEKPPAHDLCGDRADENRSVHAPPGCFGCFGTCAS